MLRAGLLALALLPGVAAAQTTLRLSETATINVHPDELAASLRAVATTASAAEAQARVNALVAAALAQAKAVAGVQVATGGYSVWQSGDRSNRWEASQSVSLRGSDPAAMLTLVGALQAKGLAVAQLGWQLAPETARRARAEASAQALRGLRGRAEDAAAILDLQFDAFRSVSLDSARPVPMLRAMAASPSAAAASPPPSAEPEDVPVSATAEAEVLLKPR